MLAATIGGIVQESTKEIFEGAENRTARFSDMENSDYQSGRESTSGQSG